jgi:hypothetical protein
MRHLIMQIRSKIPSDSNLNCSRTLVSSTGSPFTIRDNNPRRFLFPRLIPESKMRAFKQPLKTLPRPPGHDREWIDACKGGKPPGANFEFEGPITQALPVGNLALRAGGKVYWDAANLKVKNAPSAQEFVNPKYRPGWTL